MKELIAASPNPGGEFLLYQTEDGRTRIQCRFADETIWLTQAQMAELFQTTPQNVTLHLKAIFAEGELPEAATCKDYLQVRAEGGREVTRKLRYYRLEAILAVGYRVRSLRGTQFRQTPMDYASAAMAKNVLPGGTFCALIGVPCRRELDLRRRRAVAHCATSTNHQP